MFNCQAKLGKCVDRERMGPKQYCWACGMPGHLVPQCPEERIYGQLVQTNATGFFEALRAKKQFIPITPQQWEKRLKDEEAARARGHQLSDSSSSSFMPTPPPPPKAEPFFTTTTSEVEVFQICAISPVDWREEEIYHITEQLREHISVKNAEIKGREMLLTFASKEDQQKARQVVDGAVNTDGEAIAFTVRSGRCKATDIVKAPCSIQESVFTLEKAQQGLATRMTKVEQTVCSLKAESASNAGMLRSICKSLQIEVRAPDLKRPRDQIEDRQSMEIEDPLQSSPGDTSVPSEGVPHTN